MKNFHTACLLILAVASVGSSFAAFRKSGPSYIFSTPKGEIGVTPLDKDIFHIALIPEGDSVPRLDSRTLILSPRPSDVRLSITPREYSLLSPSTRIAIDRRSGLVSFSDSLGRVLISEKEGIRHGASSVSFLPVSGNISGAGERGHSLRLNGDTLVMYNRQNYGYTASDPRISQMNITVPFFASDQGFGVIFDDFAKASLILGADSVTYSSTSPAPLSYCFINGRGTLAGVSSACSAITGRQPLPPFWSLGYITSRYGYRDQRQALAVIDSLKADGYPVDAMVLDLFWYGQETDMGRFQWNQTQWPDHRKMLSDLRRRGVKVIAISQPYINKIGAIDNYNYLRDRKMLTLDSLGHNHDVTIWVGESGMLDVSNPDTRQWLWNRYKSLTDEGIEGWWGDLGEPEVHPGSIRHHNGLSASLYHNLYGNDWSRLIFEGFRKEYPDRRLMLLMRGGTAGLQRYSVFPWSTDVSRSWGGLQPQVRIMLNSGISGLGYMSSDIGGFAVDPDIPDDPELYARWLQLGTFSPTLRTHAQKNPEPYNYPSVSDISRRFIRMRYQWLPYNYTLAYQNSTLGLPLARPMNFRQSLSPEEVSLSADQYFWGDDILVAPVLHKGDRTRKVVFPEGEWIDWYDPRIRHKGVSTASVPAPLDRIPIFVRAGAFIPIYDRQIENTAQYYPDSLSVLYFPSSRLSSFTLFDDDRLSSRSIEENRFQLTSFAGISSPSETRISIRSNGGSYQGMPESRQFLLRIVGLGFKPSSVSIRGEQIPSGWSFDPATGDFTIPLSWDYSDTDIVIHK